MKRNRKGFKIIISTLVVVILLLAGYVLINKQPKFFITEYPCVLYSYCPFGGSCSSAPGYNRVMCIDDRNPCDYCESERCSVTLSFPAQIKCINPEDDYSEW